MPIVSVVMPVYNAEEYLREAIESILNQSFADFELLIIEDKSSDSSLEIIHSYPDQRINLIQNKINLGPGQSRNIGFNQAKGRYIALMDADDISLPKRLENQLRFMEDHPNIGVCGTWGLMLEKDKDDWVWDTPTSHEDIRLTLLFGSSLVNTSTLFRSALVKKYNLYYDPHIESAEDYELWVRCSNIVRLANIPEVLVKYRFHENQLSTLHRDKQDYSAYNVRKQQINALGIDASIDELDLHETLALNRYEDGVDFLNKVKAWFLKLIDANNKSICYPELQLASFLAKKYFGISFQSSKLGLVAYKSFYNSPFSNYYQPKWQRKYEFWKNCMIH